MKTHFKTSTRKLGWGWKAAILIIGTIVFGIILNTILVTTMTVGLTARGIAREQALEEAALISSSFEAQVFLSMLQLAFMLWLVRWLITRIERQPFSGSNLGLTPADRLKYILPGIVLALTLSLLTLGIGLIAGMLEYLGNGFDLFGPSRTGLTILLGAVLALASGFGEEIAFRGYLQSRITQRYHPAAAVMIVAVLFALSHPAGDVSYPLLYFATAILVGILFGTLFARTGSLWAGIALHILWNFLQIAVVAVRNSADERFSGAPLFVFDNLSGVPYRLVEMGVILVVSLIVMWHTKPVSKRHPLYTH